jgi:hypothetical protein
MEASSRLMHYQAEVSGLALTEDIVDSLAQSWKDGNAISR